MKLAWSIGLYKETGEVIARKLVFMEEFEDLSDSQAQVTEKMADMYMEYEEDEEDDSANKSSSLF